MIYAISCLSMKRHSAIFTFPSLAKLAVSLRAWTQLSILRNATPTDVISQYDYTYDAAGRRIEIARSGTAMSESRTDAYGYNVRNELTSATKTGGPQSPAAEYAYQYDDIGNRITSTDLGINRAYTANSLNQYSAITTSDFGLQTSSFEPQFDDDGNQTLIKTSTGIWSVTYNGENRPVLWTGGTQSAVTNIVMSFDRMGRRVEYTSFEEMGGVIIDKGVEHTSIVANQCKCCEIMIVSREWREYESGGTEYGIAQVNLHNRSCEDLKNQAKLVRKIPGVSVSFVYESDF